MNPETMELWIADEEFVDSFFDYPENEETQE